MSRHRRQFEEEHEALCNLQGEYRRVVSDYEAARRDLQSRFDSVEASRAAFESSVEARLNLIESESVSRTELARDYVRKSDLQSNDLTKFELETKYVTKADLHTHHLTKSELEAKYATKADLLANYLAKSDLEAKYAAKADLPLTFVTKTDANGIEERCASRAYVDQELKVIHGLMVRPNPSSRLNGIIHNLTEECGGNVHDRGVVAITSTAPYSALTSYAAKNIADWTTESFFDSADVANMWVCYDFKNRKVALTGYSIMSNHCSVPQQLKTWAIEVSNDFKDWTEADRRENRTELCEKSAVWTYAVSKPSTGRYVRLSQTGFNSSGNFNTCIAAFEVFGALTL
jgi:hypothetical protein